ncbi:MAG: hypothetical protein QOF09_2389 [Alphaproteobacteria bacterium]|nr:hypothetical protein [Alphaproteobacteria bacterium]
MRRIIISIFVSLLWAFPALAQDASHDASVAPNAAQSQSDSLADTLQAIQRSIELRLALAGFTDIQMVPTSFLISAKDRDGHSVTIMASPSSIAELGGDSKGPGQDEDSTDTPSDHPDSASQGLIEKM